MDDFKDRFRASRTAAGLSRKQAAARLTVTDTEIGFWERGDRVPDAKRQAQLLAQLELSDPDAATLVRRAAVDVRDRLLRLATDIAVLLGQTDEEILHAGALPLHPDDATLQSATPLTASAASAADFEEEADLGDPLPASRQTGRVRGSSRPPSG